MEVKGSTIREIAGTVIQVWPRKTGKGQYGDWSLQNGKLKLTTGEVVALCFKQHEDMTHLKNKAIRAVARESEKGLMGIKVGEVGGGPEAGNLQIEITGAASIEQGVGEVPPVATKPIGAPEPEVEEVKIEPVREVVKPAPRSYGYTVDDLLNLWNFIVTDPRADAGNPDITQRAAACVFIQATKDGLKAPQS